MAINLKMIDCSSLRAEYQDLQASEAGLDPDITTKIAVRLAYLNPSQKTDINLAAHYCLNGKPAIVLAVLDPTHPMADIFTIRGEAEDRRVVQYVQSHLKKQDIQQELARLEKIYS